MKADELVKLLEAMEPDRIDEFLRVVKMLKDYRDRIKKQYGVKSA